MFLRRCYNLIGKNLFLNQSPEDGDLDSGTLETLNAIALGSI
jgi:hypothetical protein